MIKFLNIINDRFYILVNFSINIVKTPIQRNFLNQFGFMLLASCLIGSHFDAISSVKRSVIIVASTQIKEAAIGLPPQAKELLENIADHLMQGIEGELQPNLIRAKMAAAEGAYHLMGASIASSKSKQISYHNLRSVICHLMGISIILPKEDANHLKEIIDHMITMVENLSIASIE